MAATEIGLKKGVVTGWPERCAALQAKANRVRSAATRTRPDPRKVESGAVSPYDLYSCLNIASNPTVPMSIDVDAYLTTILNREAVDTSIFSPLWNVQATIQPLLNEWANRYLLDVRPSGSFSKGTANASGTDIDLFISLSDRTPETLKEVYGKLLRVSRNRDTRRSGKTCLSISGSMASTLIWCPRNGKTT